LCQVNSKLLQQGRNETVILQEKGQEQMFAVQLLMRPFLRKGLSRLKSGLGFHRKFIRLHSSISVKSTFERALSQRTHHK
jgi:hypothetical protein